MITPEMWKKIVESDLPPVKTLVLLVDMKSIADNANSEDLMPYTDVATLAYDPDSEPPEMYWDGQQQQWGIGEWTHYVVIQFPSV